MPRPLLQRRLLFNPGIVVFLRLHLEIRLHVVMPEAAKLGADDFVFADFVAVKWIERSKSGDEILMDSQFRNRRNVQRL